MDQLLRFLFRNGFMVFICILLKTSICISVETSFNCHTDGLFEDETDCKMYFECLWIGTPFQKQEHHKCAENLIYNPRKHRCDNIGEFEVQFANGVQTGEELLEFMRFRNCINNPGVTSSHTDTIDYKPQPEYAPPSTDYYPQVEFLSNNEIKESSELNENNSIDSSKSNLLLNDSPAFRPRSKIENLKTSPIIHNTTESSTTINRETLKQKLSSFPYTFQSSNKVVNSTKVPLNLTTQTETTMNSTVPLSNSTQHDFGSMLLMEDEHIYFGKKFFYDSLNKNKNDTKNVEFEKTRQFNESEPDSSIRIIGTEKKRGFIKTFNNQNDVDRQRNFKGKSGVFHTTRIFKIFLNRKSDLDKNLEKIMFLNDEKSNKSSMNSSELEAEEIFYDKNKHRSSKTNIIDKDTRNKSHIVFFNDSISSNSSIANEIKNAILNNKTSTISSFRGRKLLSIDEDVPHDYTEYDDNFISTTGEDEEEIESTDPSYQDKDVQINELADRLFGKPNHHETNISNNIIDSIETRLTKRGKTNVEKKIDVTDDNHTEKVILLTEHDNTTPYPLFETTKTDSKITHDMYYNSQSPTTQFTTSLNNKVFNFKLPMHTVSSAFKRPLKFVKALPRLNNYSSLTKSKTTRLDQLNKLLLSSGQFYSTNAHAFDIYSTKAKNENDEYNYSTTQLSSRLTSPYEKMSSFYLEGSSSPQVTTIDSTTTPISTTLPTTTSTTTSTTTTTTTSTTTTTTVTTTTKTTTPTTTTSKYTTFKSTTIPASTATFTDSTTSGPFVSSSYQPIPSTAFIPSYRHSKPFMQTYRINQTKRLPNQFASLRLNYDQNAVTKIDEIERGGKFQRLRVVPADTLIECKENDFGLECSCSITLSPPKCKQLINSFLSSCRILGCKNNGRCINMAYKYPIPYVCSCPSTHMGTYCELNRDLIEEDFNKERNVKLWRNLNVVTKLPLPLSTEFETVRPMTKLISKTSTFVNPLSITNFTSSITTTTLTTTKIIKSMKIEYKESKCRLNPCMNDAECVIEKDSFKCICKNSSFTGKHCEIFRISLDKLTNSKAGSQVDLEKTTATVKPIIIKTTAVQKSQKIDSQEPLPYYTRAFFWQCPSNCLFNLGRGFCTLSSSGYPRCACRDEWTGVDCGQKNYCLNNQCVNNSTCSNYPEMRSYLCICKKNFSGRKCEIEMKTTQLPTDPMLIPQRILKSNTNPAIDSSPTTTYSTTFFKSSSIQAQKQTSRLQNQHGESTQNFDYLTSTSVRNSRPKNPCLTGKCQNNGTCVMSFSHAKNRFSFVCKCNQGYYGDLCENIENPCDPNPCRSIFKECIPLGFQKFECVCKNGQECDKKLTTSTQIMITTTNPAQTTAEVQKLTIVNSFSTSRPLGKVKHTTQTLTNSLPQESSFKYPIDMDNKEIDQEKEDIDLENKNIFSKKKMIHFLKKKLKLQTQNNICKSDEDLCLKYPYGNESFVCAKNYITQEYTVCLPTKSLNCKESNPCLNGGVCIENIQQNWKCECSKEYTGRLCETELCSPVHRLFSNHTMCLPDSPNLLTGDISNQDMDLIIDIHNTLRRQVAPIASNMQKMYWDIRLQHLAQKRAQLCSVENTGILMRQQPGYGIVIGENLAAGYEKWAHVLTSWMSESRHFIYKSTSATDNLLAGHYTQMIYSSASRIGCGFAQCSNTTYDRYFVCYYGEMQTYYSRYEPYQDGATCSKCKNNCDKGLCDCKGAFCSNGGTMDLRTCTCSCPYSTFTGRYCENVICPKEDSPFCSTTLFEDKCWLYPVVRATCPYMCSLCTHNQFSNSTTTLFRSNNIETSTMQEIIDLIANK